MPHDPYKALYIHIPFCTSRCAYCDFTTEAIAQDDGRIDAYIDDLCLEIRQVAKAGELASVETIYIGGGTPSYVGLSRLSKLLYMISVSVRLEQVGEFTIEGNPESLTLEMVRDIWALGVDRLSIGVQSFDDRILETLGRAHDTARAIEAVKTAQERFENVSVDLMCGIPGQTLDDVRTSIEQALALGVKHVSVYPLAIEEHTPLFNAMIAGEFPDIDEDEQAEHMEYASALLTEAGMHRYEVANYAFPGFESAHNTMYWTGKPYLGLGRSAVTMTQNSERRMRKQDGEILDDLDARQMAAEDLMMGMRLSRGVSDDLVAQASELLDGLDETLAELRNEGLVDHADGVWKPTDKGWLCGNELYGALFDLAP